VSSGCPWREATEFARHIGNLYNHYKSGFLLCDGAIYDQPVWYLDAMSQMNDLVRKDEARKRKADKAKHG